MTAFAVSPDEGSLAVSGRNGLLRQWDLEAGSLTRTWKVGGSLHGSDLGCLSVRLGAECWALAADCSALGLER